MHGHRSLRRRLKFSLRWVILSICVKVKSWIIHFACRKATKKGGLELELREHVLKRASAKATVAAVTAATAA